MRTLTERREEFAVGSDIRVLGICADCIDRQLCTQRRNWAGPVFFCEEYTNVVETAGRKAVLRPVVEPVAEPRATRTEHRGLCVNCERRADCCFTKPEGGVWHCEEYE